MTHEISDGSADVVAAFRALAAGGHLIGPRIVMLIIALMIGTLGSFIPVIRLLCDYKACGLSTGLWVTILGILITRIWIVDARLTCPEALFLTAFIAAPGFVVNILGWNAASSSDRFDSSPSVQESDGRKFLPR